MKRKKVLIIGSSGYIGQILHIGLSSVYKVDVVSGPTSQLVTSLDLTRKEDVKHFFSSREYDVVINCAGTKDIKACNSNPELTVALNCHIVENLLQQMNNNCQFVHISSDYILPPFSSAQHNIDLGETYPDTTYGESKIIAEYLCRIYNKNYVIVRIAGVYSPTGGFFSNLMKAYRQNETFFAFSNWYYSPLYYATFIEGVISLIEDEVSRQTLNLVGERVSRYDFAKEVLEQGQFNANLLGSDNDAEHEIVDRSLPLSNFFLTKDLRYLSHRDAIKDAINKAT